MQIVLFLILGIGIGVLVGWLWARSRETGILQQLLRTEGQQKAAAQAELRQTRTSLDELGSVRSQLSNESQRRVAAETKLKEAEANLEQQRRLLEEATVKLTDAFGALSAEALKSNNQAFLALAKSTFETMHAQAKGDLVAQQSAIDGLLSPLKEALSRYEKQASGNGEVPPIGVPEPGGTTSEPFFDKPAYATGNRKFGHGAALAAGARALGRDDAEARGGTGGNVGLLRFR